LIAVFSYQKAGRKVDGRTVGDDLTRVAMRVHDDYRGLVRFSLSTMAGPWLETRSHLEDQFRRANLTAWEGRGKSARPVPVPVSLFGPALDAVRGSLEEALDRPPGSSRRPGRIYRPLRVEGAEIAGAWTWSDPEDETSGIELTGEIVGRKVLRPAQWAAPRTRSAPETVAKAWVRARLPVDRWVVYALPMGAEVLWGRDAEDAGEAEGLFELPAGAGEEEG